MERYLIEYHNGVSLYYIYIVVIHDSSLSYTVVGELPVCFSYSIGIVLIIVSSIFLPNYDYLKIVP